MKKTKGSNIQDELRRKMLCFTCQEPYVSIHKCAKGKAQYIELFSSSEEEEYNEEP